MWAYSFPSWLLCRRLSHASRRPSICGIRLQLTRLPPSTAQYQLQPPRRRPQQARLPGCPLLPAPGPTRLRTTTQVTIAFGNLFRHNWRVAPMRKTGSPRTAGSQRNCRSDNGREILLKGLEAKPKSDHRSPLRGSRASGADPYCAASEFDAHRRIPTLTLPKTRRGRYGRPASA